MQAHRNAFLFTCLPQKPPRLSRFISFLFRSFKLIYKGKFILVPGEKWMCLFPSPSKALLHKSSPPLHNAPFFRTVTKWFHHDYQLGPSSEANLHVASDLTPFPYLSIWQGPSRGQKMLSVGHRLQAAQSSWNVTRLMSFARRALSVFMV